MPRFALNALPAGVLIGAMLGIGALARGNELTAMRAAGMAQVAAGCWRCWAADWCCCSPALVVGEFVAPRLEQLADERKAFAKYET